MGHFFLSSLILQVWNVLVSSWVIQIFYETNFPKLGYILWIYFLLNHFIPSVCLTRRRFPDLLLYIVVERYIRNVITQKLQTIWSTLLRKISRPKINKEAICGQLAHKQQQVQETEIFQPHLATGAQKYFSHIQQQGLRKNT